MSEGSKTYGLTVLPFTEDLISQAVAATGGNPDDYVIFSHSVPTHAKEQKLEELKKMNTNYVVALTGKRTGEPGIEGTHFIGVVVPRK